MFTARINPSSAASNEEPTSHPIAWDQSVALGNSSCVYSLVLGSNGDLWVLPQNAGGSRNRKMIRCPAGALAQCAAFGSDLIVPSDGSAQAIVLIPGASDLLIATNTRIIRYDTSAGTGTDIFDLQTLSRISDINQMRHMIIHE